MDIGSGCGGRLPPRVSERGAFSWTALSALLALGFMAGVIVLAFRRSDQGIGGSQPARAEPSLGQSFTIPPDPCGAPDPANPADLSLDPSGGVLDFGRVSQDTKAEKEIRFRSTGTGPLCIYGVHSGCGCFRATLAEKEKRRYEPGEEGRVVVALDATGRVGPVTKSVTIHTNAYKTPHRTLRVVADVSAGVLVSPSHLRFRSVPRKTGSSASLLVQSAPEAPEWKIVEVVSGDGAPEGSPARYSFTLRPVPDPRYRKFLLVVEHPGRETTGTFREPILIRTTHPDRPRIPVDGHIQVIERILTSTQRVALGLVESGQPSEPVRVRFWAGAPGLKVALRRAWVVPPAGLGVEAAHGGFRADLGRDDQGWYVDVRYDGTRREAGLLEGDLVVLTQDAHQPEIRLPVSAEVR